MPDLTRHSAVALHRFAAELLGGAGLAADRADTVAKVLLEGDLMGHTTHGLALLAPYLSEIEKGTMTVIGDPETVRDYGSTVTWDGRYLPGPWLTMRALDLACERARSHNVATVVIRRSHHIACLQAYLKRATDRGLFVLLMCSDPSMRSVAPFGAVTPVYTPNPLAFGWPTDGDPVLVDISASTTTNGLSIRLNREGRKLDGPWLVDADGNPSDDPAVLFGERKGAILPLGGTDLGHKGFGLGLLVEALTAALGGHGRADEPARWGASVFLQVIDPEAFGGRDAFVREAGWLAAACREASPAKEGARVRLPGERGLRLRAEQLRAGVALHPEILPALQPWAEKLKVAMPF